MTWFLGSFIKRQTSGTLNDNKWQRVKTSSTTSDSEWQIVTMNDNERQRVVQRMKANESDFRFQNETIIQCKTAIYSATSYWKYNVLILLKLHGTTEHLQKQPLEVFYKNACSEQFCNFTGKHLKACNFIKKRLQRKFFPVNIAKFLRTPILENICEQLLNCICFVVWWSTFPWSGK